MCPQQGYSETLHGVLELGEGRGRRNGREREGRKGRRQENRKGKGQMGRGGGKGEEERK